MHVTEHALFPTRLLAITFPDADDLNQELADLFDTHEAFRGDFDMHPDSLNLLRLASEVPCVARVQAMFLGGLRAWLRAERITGEYAADVTVFSNVAGPGDFTLVHNHGAEVVGVYYVRTSDTDRPPVVVPEPDGDYDYFAAEDAALVLHDPRFNANLVGLRSTDYAKVFPRPGLMVIFPGYLWHSVTPARSDVRRLALSANFVLKPAGGTNAVTVSV